MNALDEMPFFFLVGWFDIVLVGMHIPGVENRAAYALSRNNLPDLLLQMPRA